MLQNAVPRLFNIAGKVFVLGEYAVLAGRPALVASVGPRFSLSMGGTRLFDEQSPAGRLLKWARSQGASTTELRFTFGDPHGGLGGFGCSTAQFALVYSALADDLKWPQEWEHVWRLYRDLMGDAGALTPSGADLVAQWCGGVSLFDPSAIQCVDVWSSLAWGNLIVFSATGQPGRKVPTHEHLQALSRSGGFMGPNDELLHVLEEPLIRGIAAVRDSDFGGLGQAMTEYADVLWNKDLEAPAAHEDRRVLSALPGVLGVKGAGALLSDAILVLMSPRSEGREELIAAAAKRGLRLVANGLSPESGVIAR